MIVTIHRTKLGDYYFDSDLPDRNSVTESHGISVPDESVMNRPLFCGDTLDVPRIGDRRREPFTAAQLLRAARAGDPRFVITSKIG